MCFFVSCVSNVGFALFQGIMLVYDITNEKSFDNIRNWIRNIEEVGISGWTLYQKLEHLA